MFPVLGKNDNRNSKIWLANAVDTSNRYNDISAIAGYAAKETAKVIELLANAYSNVCKLTMDAGTHFTGLMGKQG